MIKSYFEDPVVVPGDEQKYIVKSYEETTNTNIAVTYNNRYTMNEDIKKLMFDFFFLWFQFQKCTLEQKTLEE